MKKLLTFMIMLGVFLIPRYTTQAALTPPTSYDYSFVYDSTDGEFQFKDGTNSYTPEFTQSFDGTYYDYEYIGNGNNIFPFNLEIRFENSNTSWTLGTTGYIATDTKIGSDGTVGSPTFKFRIIIDNISDNDYLMLYDTVSTASADRSYFYQINNVYISNQSSDRLYYRREVIITNFFIPSHSNVNIRNSTDNKAVYVDALYFLDLGTSLAVQSTTAYDSGYDDGFGDGYLTGVAEDNAYAIGYAKGLIDGGDMETGSSILIFVVAAIGFIMMIFGFTTRRGIFNLLSVGAFVVLGAMLAQYIGFIIIAIGLVIINVYYAFWGDL